MSNASIEARVKQVLSNELCYKPEVITSESKLSVDLDANSMDMIMVQVGLEDEFGIDIPDKDFYKSMSVSDIVSLIANLTQEKVAV